MKSVGIFTVLLSLIVAGSAPALSLEQLPDSGTFFIVNVASEQALQPAANSMGQNVLLYDYSMSGNQKWVVTRRYNPKTHQPTNRYTIRLSGATPGLNLQPHPSVSDGCAILGDSAAVYTLEQGLSGLVIKSVNRNGDAMYDVPSPPMQAETKFGPNNGSKNFQWNFIAAEAED